MFIYLYVVHFFARCYHANETSSAVPLNGTMYLIVSFYASWREGQGGKRSVFRRCGSVEGLVFTLPRIPQEIPKYGVYSSPSASIPGAMVAESLTLDPF